MKMYTWIDLGAGKDMIATEKLFLSTETIESKIRRASSVYCPPEAMKFLVSQEKQKEGYLTGSIDAYCWGMCFYQILLNKTDEELIEEGTTFKLKTETEYRVWLGALEKAISSIAVVSKDEAGVLLVIAKILLGALAFKKEERLTFMQIREIIADFDKLSGKGFDPTESIQLKEVIENSLKLLKITGAHNLIMDITEKEKKFMEAVNMHQKVVIEGKAELEKVAKEKEMALKEIEEIKKNLMEMKEASDRDNATKEKTKSELEALEKSLSVMKSEAEENKVLLESQAKKIAENELLITRQKKTIDALVRKVAESPAASPQKPSSPSNRSKIERANTTKVGDGQESPTSKMQSATSPVHTPNKGSASSTDSSPTQKKPATSSSRKNTATLPIEDAMTQQKKPEEEMKEIQLMKQEKSTAEKAKRESDKQKILSYLNQAKFTSLNQISLQCTCSLISDSALNYAQMHCGHLTCMFCAAVEQMLSKHRFEEKEAFECQACKTSQKIKSVKLKCGCTIEASKGALDKFLRPQWSKAEKKIKEASCHTHNTTLDLLEMFAIFGGVMLRVCNSGLTSENVKDICTSIVKDVNMKVTGLYLGANKINDDGAVFLAEFLKTNNTILALDLNANEIRAPGAKAISEALTVNTTLTQLEIGGNAIQDEGAQYLSEALKLNPSITFLNLRANNIKDAGISLIAASLSANKSITYLDLRLNGFSTEGAKAISSCFLANNTLCYLDLAYNAIDALGGKAFGEALQRNACITHLDISGNKIGDIGGKAIAEALKTNECLMELNLQDCGIGVNAGKSFAVALKSGNYSLNKLNLSCNEGKIPQSLFYGTLCKVLI